MTLERFVDLVAGVAPDVTADELADAIWLAPQLPATPGDSAGPAPADEPPDEPAPVREPPVPPVDDSADPVDTRSEPSVPPSPAPDPVAGMYAGTGADETGGAEPGILSPRAPALPRQLDFVRALRSLKRTVPSHREEVLDEDATAEAVAESGLRLPVLRGAPERWLSVALIVDDGPSMDIWRDTVAEFAALLQYTGAFRDVRVWRLNTDADIGDRFLLRSDGPDEQTVARSPWELLDPGGRRLIIVVSDCIGKAWRDRRVPRLLEHWGRTGHVSVMQPLPQRLWRRCVPAIAAVRVHAPGRAAPNARLVARYRDVADPGDGYRHLYGEEPSAADGQPVPVFELSPRWLARWAQIITGAANWNDVPVMFTRRAPNPDHAAAQVRMSAEERIRRFRNGASSEAFDLAGYLAFAPLTPPVMRLVQEAVLPSSRTAHLAEVLLGGLLRRTQAAGATDDRTVLYEFHPGVRELLRATVRRSTALRTLTQVSRYVLPRLGTSVDFPALLRAPRHRELTRLAQLDRPFAVVARSALRGLGGRYADIADQLGEVLQPVPTSDVLRRATDTDTPLHVTGGGSADRLPEFVTQPTAGGEVTYPPRGQAGRDPRGTAPAVWIGVPPRNPYFTGREDLLHDIHEHLTGKVTALVPHTLHGHGGVGKTHLAIEYVYRYQNEYDLVCWISAEQPTLVRSGIAELAKELGLQFLTVDDAVRAVRSALQNGEPYANWLLVFDNATQPEEINEFLLQGSGHVLVTSRSDTWREGAAQVIEVDVFPRAESIAFLSARLGTPPDAEVSAEDADQLSDRLDDLPLALEQAAAWQVETGMPLQDYVRLFDERLAGLVDSTVVREQVRPTDYPLPVAVTWSLALEQLRDTEPQVVHLLRLCAFFAPEPIPWSLLAAGRSVAELPREVRASLRSPRDIDRMIRTIKRYALAQVDYGSNRLQLHRLAQAVLRAQLSESEFGEIRHQAHALIAAADPGDPDVLANWERYGELWPHVEPSGAVECDHEEVRELVLNLARYLYMQGGYGDGRDFADTTLRRWREVFPEDDLRTLILTRRLAEILRALGQVDAARELAVQAYDQLRRFKGENDEETLSTGNFIGATLRDLGRFQEALDQDRALYDRHVEVFTEQHPRTLMSANNLALDYFLVGDYERAREIDSHTLNLRRRVLGESRPFTLFSESSLARDLREGGEYWQARNQLEATLDRYRGTLGPQHPDTLRTAKNLSVARRKVGDYAAALELSRETYNAYYARLGGRHPDTLSAAVNLFTDHRLTHDFDEALRLAADTLAGYRDVLGEGHPFTLATENNYAIALRQAGRLDDARTLSEHAFTGLRDALGPHHPYTLSAATTYASDLHAAERFEQARDLLEDTYASFKEVLGRDHPYTLASAVNLVSELHTVGQDDDADRLADVTLRRYEEVLGADHPEVVAGRATGVRGECSIESTPT